MSSPAPAPASADPELADAIAWAERRRAVLGRLTDVGMEFVQETRQRFVNGPYHPEPRHDPGRSFAAIARSIRMSLAFEGRVTMDILAMRKGGMPLGFGAGGNRAAGPATSAPDAEERKACEGSRTPERERETLIEVEAEEDFDLKTSPLPFMENASTTRSEVRGGEVEITPEIADDLDFPTPLACGESTLPIKGRDEELGDFGREVSSSYNTPLHAVSRPNGPSP